MTGDSASGGTTETEALRRFVFVQPHLKFGGAESQTVAIVNGLAKRGYECSVVLHRATGQLLDELDPRVRVVDLGFESHAAVLGGALRVKKVLQSLPASLVVVRLWSSISMVGLVARNLDQHDFVYFEDLDPRDHTDFIRFGRLKHSIVKAVFRRNQTRLVANTEHVADAMIESYGLSHRPDVISCGIDSDAVRAKSGSAGSDSDNHRNDALRVVTVGSLIHRKGITELYNALSMSGRAIEWTLVGEGPLDEWLRIASRNSGNVRVILAGGTTNPHQYTAKADLMVHGARSESFGVVLLESIALDTPVVANMANGPREIVKNLPNAAIRLFDISDPLTLSHAIEEVFDARVRLTYSNALDEYELETCLDAWERRANG